MSLAQITLMQASAGSGKTYNLAKRYLYLLLGSFDNIDIKNIIAVTFTNKAAVEMKYRILNYLKMAALSQDSINFFADLNLPPKDISRKSLLALQNILEHYDSFNISTLDSFKNRILKSCAINMDISPNFSIEPDYSQNLKFALEAFLHKSNTSQNIRDIILKYLDQYLTNDLGWFAKDNIYNEIEKVFEKSGSIGKDINFSRNNNFGKEFYLKVELVVKKIKCVADKIANLQINGHFLNAVKKVLLEGNRIFFSMNIPAKFAYQKLEYKNNATMSLEANILWEEIYKDVKDLCNFYMQNYYQIYSYMYHEVVKEFDIKSKKDAVVFLNEINKKTVKFFKDTDVIIPEVYYRLSEKYKHFLIDEFQDTSFVQWVGIKRFLDESLATGGTLFCVGDVKQSIYSFRGAKPELFYNMPKEFSTSSIENQHLETNFRSSKEIVFFNNEIFSVDNLQRFLNVIYEDLGEEVNFDKFLNTYRFSGQKIQDNKKSGYVEIDFIEKDCQDVKEETKQKFIKYVIELLNRSETKSIAVLCRSNDEILDISSWLLEKNIEVESSQTLNIKNNDVIKQIVSFFAFINSPIDSLAFSSFIIGDIFNKVANIDQAEFEQFIFNNKDNGSGFVYKIFKDKYENLWNEYFEYFFVKAGFIPVYELALSVLEKFKILENYPDSKAFVMHFLEIIKEFELQKSALSNFLEYFYNLSNQDDFLYIKNAFGNGIKVMTVHKSKGLQFPVVIIPFLKLVATNIDKPYFDDSKEEIDLLNISKSIGKFSAKANEIYNKERLDSLLSELNVLYVCLTRAEHEIYAIVPPKAGTSNNLAYTLFGDRSFKRGNKQKYNIKVTKNNYVCDCFNGGYKDISNNFINRKNTIVDIDDVKKRGTILHYCLSKFKIINGNLNDSIGKALEVAKRKFPFENTSFLKEKLQQMFSKEKILELFNCDGVIYNEKEIVNSKGEIFRIDKLIELDDKILVLDFKSSDYNFQENKEQLLNYVSLISEIYPNKKIIAYIVNLENAMLIQV
ncbi:MAG: UvrD-helicase domain-containing protein [Elusimicrobiota bacterium]|jgi:ATP-dependent exoDNAse (exonuclease V) beta subunit|nr:UvrD-helicase domain-containing protein [Elusimicrobiota bacterium]